MRIKHIAMAVKFACFEIGNNWRQRHGLPLNP